VVVGDLDESTVAYEVLCRTHFREGTTRSGADLPHATRSGVDEREPVSSTR
jgi:hypothetical protein